MTTVARVVTAQPLLDARRRVEQIRTHVEDIKGLIVAAYRARDWETLGYANWTEYCTAEFGGTVAIPRDERGDVVFTLRDAGLSTRAIGAAIGVTDTTVRRDLAGATNVAPAPAPTPPDPDDEVVEAEIIEDAPPAAPPTPRPVISEATLKDFGIGVGRRGEDGGQVADPLPEPTPGLASRITGTDGKSYSAARSPSPTAKTRSGKAILPQEPIEDLGPQSAPKGQTKTYRERFNEAMVIPVEAMTVHIGDFYPADRVALIATDVEEYDAWIADLRRARQRLSTYIHQLEKARPGGRPS